MRKNRNKSEMKINYKNILKIVIPILIIIIFLLIINYVRKDKNNDKIVPLDLKDKKHEL